MYPSVLERISELSKMKIQVSARLPADHPFEPPMIEPLQFVPADVETIGEPVGPESTNLNVSEPSILDESTIGELPDFEPNLQQASEIASE
jgi:hypothetical protein